MRIAAIACVYVSCCRVDGFVFIKFFPPKFLYVFDALAAFYMRTIVSCMCRNGFGSGIWGLYEKRVWM